MDRSNEPAFVAAPNTNCRAMLHPCRNRNRPDMTAFSSKVRDHPMGSAKLKILEPERRQFRPPETASDKKREQSTIASAAESVRVFRSQQLLDFFRGRLVSDGYSQATYALNTPNACREIRTEKSAIGCFIRQSPYRRQSQVNCRRGVPVLFGN